MNIKKSLLPLGLTLFLVACGQGTSVEPGAGDTYPQIPAVDEVQSGGDVVWLSNADAVQMDPHLTNDIPSLVFQSQVFEGLIAITQEGEIVPSLAESFYTVEPTVWQFNLRQGVYFHDGTPFNAEAVVINLNRFLDPELASPGASILDMVTDVLAVDEYTVHIHTAFPFSPLPSHLTVSGGLIASPTALAAQENGTGPNIGEAPIGTGPFVMYSRDHGDNTVFVRNENYWGDLATVESVTIRVIPEAGTRLAMLEAGEAHGFTATAIDVPSLRLMDGVNYFTEASAATEYIGFNLTEGHPLSNLYLRQAISKAIDRAEMIEMMGGLALPATSMAAPQLAYSPFGTLEIQPFDIEGARDLLAQTPWPDGLTLSFWYNDGSTIRSQIAQLVQFYLAQIGITIEITSMDWGAYLAAIGAIEHDMFVLNWVALTGDSDRAFHPLFHTENHGVAGNRFLYSSPVADDLIDRARQTTDPATRYTLYQELVEVLAQDLPMLPLWHIITPFAYSTAMEGFQVDFRSVPNFTNVTILE
ncbi:MAG: ABC transporter substrate-binding protein [Defluviitaleaceae bacterium]|nr:ABC transporter substrate-binding protein [Defluviitaleaceae bacterium]